MEHKYLATPFYAFSFLLTCSYTFSDMRAILDGKVFVSPCTKQYHFRNN